MNNSIVLQVLILMFQGFLLSSLLLFLFHLRKKFGLGLLFTALGMFQFIQIILSSTLDVQISNTISISPGFSIVFTASLFSILLIYIKEDAFEARKVIYALVLVNLVLALLVIPFSNNLNLPQDNKLIFTGPHFKTYSLLIIFGAIVLFLDAILIIVSYEFVSRVTTNLFLKIVVSMMVVVSFDTICFSLGGFWLYKEYSDILFSDLIVKNIIAVYYSLIFSFYLKYLDNKDISDAQLSFADVFNTLTYRQKFEIMRKEKEEAQKKADEIALMSERRFETLANNSPVGIFRTTADGETDYVNERWMEISGISKEESKGSGWMEAVHRDDRTGIGKAWEEAVKKQERSVASYRFVHRNGEVRWVLGQAIPEYDARNEIIGYIGTITDITDQKKNEEALKQAIYKAEESDRLKSAFLANMSHEIRTPMNGILGFANLLKKQKVSDEIKDQYLSVIEKSGERMLNILNDIINISKIEAGEMDIKYSQVNLDEKLDFFNSFFIPEASKKNVEIRLVKEPAGQESVLMTDESKFEIILSNLLKNALKFTESGYIEFGYTRNGDFFQFFVRDTGMGIPEEKMKIIFERFRQGHEQYINHYEGAGLGLSISKSFVELLGGEIWVESNPPTGSVFNFTLPGNT